MKYIENPELSRLAQALTHEGPECAVHTRIEAYSCKNIKRDKRLFRSLEHAYNDEVSHSPPLPSWLEVDREAETTPFGPIDKSSSRKTLYLLIATLNIAFPDYEFSDVRPAHFQKEPSGASVLNALSTTLVAPHRAGVRAPRTYSSYPPVSADFFPSSVPTSSSPLQHMLASPFAPPQIVAGTHPTLYRLLDDVIGLSECEVYSYAPDIESDPHASNLSDDEDSGPDDDSDSGTDPDDDATFEFDDYDVDEAEGTSGSPPRAFAGRARPIPRPLLSAGRPAYMHRRGALLWSSHWFFLNRKLNRILFITVWAHTRGMKAFTAADDDGYASALSGDKAFGGERFVGWEGGVGAGARALGISASEFQTCSSSVLFSSSFPYLPWTRWPRSACPAIWPSLLIHLMLSSSPSCLFPQLGTSTLLLTLIMYSYILLDIYVIFCTRICAAVCIYDDDVSDYWRKCVVKTRCEALRFINC